MPYDLYHLHQYGHHSSSPLSTFFLVGRSGLLGICQQIITSVNNKNPANEDGTTPLHDAAIEGHTDIVRLILANVNDKNPADSESGETPLHFAARGGHLEICREILAHLPQDDKNPDNGDGLTPLSHAVIEGHDGVCKLIVDSMVDNDMASVLDKVPIDQYLTMAEEKGHKEIVRYLNDLKFLLS